VGGQATQLSDASKAIVKMMRDMERVGFRRCQEQAAELLKREIKLRKEISHG
jgi:hypothetical protein